MKRILGVLLTLAALPVFAGVTYDFQVTSSGTAQGNISGTVYAESPNARMDVKTGDGLIFKDNALVLSTDGGKTMSVFDRDAKTYYVINFNDLVGNTASLLGSMGKSVKLTFANPKVSARDLGDGETIAGYPTKRSALDAAYDINVEAMGTKLSMHIDMTTETSSTDKLSAEYTNFLQAKNLRTGYAEIDALIDAQSGAMKGRFPLKQVSKVHVSGTMGDMTSTSTSEVSNIVVKKIDAATFTAPAGFTKVDDPLSRLMKNLR